MPDSIGGYRVLERLGSGGQGVVYLAESDSGEQVAVKLMHAVADERDTVRFLREAAVLPQVASFCTAQVLSSGTEDGRPYIISEYIAGPTLLAAVRERGPFQGSELRRLAVGTVTALAAIHRAGVVHRDFKPGNVLLSREGPRVIDFGIARPVDADATGGGLLGTPAYMAPELFSEQTSGPAADMFAWAATIVFAATGTPPFGQDTLPAIMRRLLTEDPQLDGVGDGLRDVVATCLVKNPAMRPRASQVLLGLLGRPATSLSEGVLAEGEAVAAATTTQPSIPPPPARRSRRPAVLAGTALAVLALGASVTVVTLNRPAPKVTTTPLARPVARQVSGPPAADAHAVSVPQLKGTFYEAPSDFMRLSSMIVQEGDGYPAYVRVRGKDTFDRLPEYRIPVVSPDATRVASVYRSPRYAAQNQNDLVVTDRTTGASFSITVVDRPSQPRLPRWTPDSRRLLLTVTDLDLRATGFAIVDVVARTSTYVKADNVPAGTELFNWMPGGQAVYAQGAQGKNGMTVYGLDGSRQRSIDVLRRPTTAEIEYSPTSGRLIVGDCVEKARAVCLLDAATGAREGRFVLPGDSYLWGWFNDDHLLVYSKAHLPWSVDVVDLTGKPVRRFATFESDKNANWTTYFGPG
ncbi:serine/threonine protein kinase [Streptosporangiaceae bacterium NEAU-GS5]|nr:serine/threonine protein kinase [Streptosporangiaceae bacterium NEAU-GS5]